MQAFRYLDVLVGRHLNVYKVYIKTDRQTDQQTDRQTDKQSNI